MNREEVERIVSEAREKDERPDPRWADLTGANLAGADLADANLADANLADANLADANLADANLAGASLTEANLRWADLADANLADANLTGANLAGANLTGANLTGAGGVFVTWETGAKHLANFAGGYGYIGCKRHTYQEWLDGGEIIGAANGYTPTEIAVYMAFIRGAVDYLRTLENEDGSPKVQP